MIQKNELQTDVLLNPVAAISAGIVNGRTLLDLCYGEDVQAHVDANIVMNSKGEFIEIQYTAERRPFSRALLDNMLDLAWKGISELFIAQRSILNAEGIVTE
jgi:ribonuclease PH